MRLARVQRRRPGLAGEPAMSKAADKLRRSGERDAGRPRFGLPSDLSGSLRHLDDQQLDRLVRAVAEEERRRGRASGGEGSSRPGSASSKGPAFAPVAGETAKKRALPIAPGQVKVIRAAYRAGGPRIGLAGRV